MNIKIIAGALAAFLLVGVFWYTASDGEITREDTHEVAEHADDLASYEVSPAAVVKRVQANEGAVLLDVRTPEEYETLHLENALLLPVQELSAGTLADIGLGADAKDKEIVLYCRSGARSKTAYDIMTSLGYTNIVSVAGGMVHWEEDQYPLTETGAYTGPTYGSGATTLKEITEGPELTVDRELHDFGYIPQFGGTVETTFELTNTGTEVLEIGTLTTSCSCTSASVDEASLEPNESTTMTVVFDPDLHEEPFDVFKRTVFIPTNDQNNPEIEVAVQVDIAEGE
jgi:rhodanese-related sulfurtransferase